MPIKRAVKWDYVEEDEKDDDDFVGS